MLLLTSKRFYERWYDLGIGFVAPMFGIGTVIMAAFSPANEVPLVGGRLLLASFFFYFMIGLRFRAAARANLIVFAALVVAFLAGTMPTATATYLMFTLFTANIIGVAGSYALEHANRTAFLEHRQLTEVATHDGLTTLLNRAAFEDQIRRVWQQAQRDRQTVAVIMIDIDYFKAYNDRYGHIAGDDCLRRVSSALRDAARRRPLDFVARYGGEELVAVLYGADKVLWRKHRAQPADRGARAAHSACQFRNAALRHRERGCGCAWTPIASPRTTPPWRWPTRRCTPPNTRAAIVTWRSEYSVGKVDPAATTVLPLRESDGSLPRKWRQASLETGPDPVGLRPTSAVDRDFASAGRGPLPRNIPSLLNSSTISPRGSTAITPPLPPSAFILPSTLADRLCERQLEVFHLRADVVRDHGANEVFAVPGRRHRAARVVA